MIDTQLKKEQVFILVFVLMIVLFAYAEQVAYASKDVNGEGIVDPQDIARIDDIQKFIDLEITGEDVEAADLEGNNVVDKATILRDRKKRSDKNKQKIIVPPEEDFILELD